MELAEEIHRELKRKALLESRTLRNVVTDLVESYLSAQSREGLEKSTGLCGVWQDERSAEEIVGDIRKNRKWLTRTGRARVQIRS